MSEALDSREPFIEDARHCEGCGINELDAEYLTSCDPHDYLHCTKCKCPQCEDARGCVFCGARLVSECKCPEEED